MGLEKFKSTYPTTTETELSIKPQFGLLLNIKYFNTYLGWYPSEPQIIIVGLGFTLYGKSIVTDPGF